MMNLHRLSYESLQILCLENGLSVQGTREQIIDRLHLYALTANDRITYISNSSSSSDAEDVVCSLACAFWKTIV